MPEKKAINAERGDSNAEKTAINAQDILKDQFPHVDGFQSPVLAQNDGFIPVQGEGKHSVCF